MCEIVCVVWLHAGCRGYLGNGLVALPQQGRLIVRGCEDPQTLNRHETVKRQTAPLTHQRLVNPAADSYHGVEVDAGDSLRAAFQSGSVSQRA